MALRPSSYRTRRSKSILDGMACHWRVVFALEWVSRKRSTFPAYSNSLPHSMACRRAHRMAFLEDWSGIGSRWSIQCDKTAPLRCSRIPRQSPSCHIGHKFRNYPSQLPCSLIGRAVRWAHQPPPRGNCLLCRRWSWARSTPYLWDFSMLNEDYFRLCYCCCCRHRWRMPMTMSMMGNLIGWTFGLEDVS